MAEIRTDGIPIIRRPEQILSEVSEARKELLNKALKQISACLEKTYSGQTRVSLGLPLSSTEVMQIWNPLAAELYKSGWMITKGDYDQRENQMIVHISPKLQASAEDYYNK